MEIETQRQSAFFLFVGHGNRFVEEILAPSLFIRFGPHEEAPSHLAEATRLWSSSLVAFIMWDAI